MTEGTGITDIAHSLNNPFELGLLYNIILFAPHTYQFHAQS